MLVIGRKASAPVPPPPPPPPPSGWTPSSLTNLEFWLDANEASTLTVSGGSVSEWRDRSGKSRHFSNGTTAFQPAYSATGLNGKPALNFTGDDVLSSGLVTVTGLAGNLSAFIVSSVSVTSGNGSTSRILNWTGNGQPNDYSSTGSAAIIMLAGQLAVTMPQIVAYKAGYGNTVAIWPGAYDVPPAAASWDTPFIGGATFDQTANQMRSWANGYTSPTAVGSSGAFTETGTMRVGGMFGGDFLGLVSEVVVTSTVLSTELRQKLEGYLAHKWSLTGNLASDHPYKTVAP